MRKIEMEYGRFALLNYGNGCAYELIDKITHMSVVMQGDDALSFESDREAAEACFPHKTHDEIMRWLWDQCDYGSAAQKSEG
jgi:hypothetical protein